MKGVMTMIERVAQVMCDGDAVDYGVTGWLAADKELRDGYRRAAQHAIDAIQEHVQEARADELEQVAEQCRDRSNELWRESVEAFTTLNRSRIHSQSMGWDDAADYLYNRAAAIRITFTDSEEQEAP